MTEHSPDSLPVRSRPLIERHIQTVMLGLVIALLAWSGTTTLKLVETSARQDERIMQLITSTNELKNELQNTRTQYMTLDAAGMYRQQINSRIDQLDFRLKALEDIQ